MVILITTVIERKGINIVFSDDFLDYIHNELPYESVGRIKEWEDAVVRIVSDISHPGR